MRNPNTLKWSDLKTGIFFMVGIGLAAYLGLVVGKNSSLFKSVTTINMLAPNVENLAENNYVSVAGKKIGTVSSLDFVTRDDSLMVLIELKLQNEHADIVTRDSRASIKSLGILGDKYIDITTGHAEPVTSGDYIALDQSGVSMSSLTESAAKAMEELNTLLADINEGRGPVGRLLKSEEMADNLDETIASLNSFSKELRDGDGALQKLISDKSLATDLAQAVANINDAASNADELFSKLSSDNGTIGQLHSNPALYRNLNESLQSLDSLLVDLKENPKRYVRFSIF